MRPLLLSTLIVFSSSLFAQSRAFQAWQAYLEKEVRPTGFDTVFPDTAHLQMPWRPRSDVVFDRTPPAPHELTHVPLSCANQALWPTHPQQFTKSYLHAAWSPYDHARLPADSTACQTTTTNRRFCLRATWANLLVLSDTFEDDCGNRYRGYWLVEYLQIHDNMGTLLSKGRTVYPRPNSPFPGDFEEGQTYQLSARDLLFLTDLSAEDEVKITEARTRALATRYRLQGHLFLPQ